MTLGKPHMRVRLLRTGALCLLAFAYLFSTPVFEANGNAWAQEIRERRSILDFLFSRNKKTNNDAGQPARKKTTRKKNKSTTASPASQATADAVVEKIPDARKVLVIGDFMAGALADGLVMAFAGDPAILVEKRSSGSSGLVRDDYLNWPETLATYIDEIKPAVVVVTLGANDRQQMAIGGHKEKFRSEAWNSEYEKRISALLDVAGKSKVPLVWSGLPAFQSPSLSADAATLNSLYRTKAESAGAVFIDVWDGFADENGKFIASGSDVNGQPVRLRGSDGLSLTKAGKRKMAFYLEKAIRSAAGVAEGLPLASLDTANVAAGRTDVPATIATITTVPPMSLSDPELDGTSVLLDSGLLPKATGATPRDRLIEKGETADAPQGRVDDFRWPADKAEPAG